MCTVVRTCMRSELHRWPRLQRSPRISTPSAAHFLKSHQSLVQKFVADRNRQKGHRSRRLLGATAIAQQTTGVPGSPNATTTIPGRFAQCHRVRHPSRNSRTAERRRRSSSAGGSRPTSSAKPPPGKGGGVCRAKTFIVLRRITGTVEPQRGNIPLLCS